MKSESCLYVEQKFGLKALYYVRMYVHMYKPMIFCNKGFEEKLR